MDVGDIPVTIIVKAPTQEIEDQTIHCRLDWTIDQLKRHLTNVYPNEPVSTLCRAPSVKFW